MNNIGERKITLVVICAIVIFITIVVVVVVFMFKNNNKKIAEHKQHTEKIYGNIQFKGRVLKVYEIERWGRLCGMMCIKLDYTNVGDFYKFNELSCLKIRNGIITLPTGSLSNDAVKSNKRVNAILSAVYIEVNMDNSRQMVFIDSLGNKFIQDYLYYRSGNLIESDMRICDDCNPQE